MKGSEKLEVKVAAHKLYSAASMHKINEVLTEKV